MMQYSRNTKGLGSWDARRGCIRDAEAKGSIWLQLRSVKYVDRLWMDKYNNVADNHVPVAQVGRTDITTVEAAHSFTGIMMEELLELERRPFIPLGCQRTWCGPCEGLEKVMELATASMVAVYYNIPCKNSRAGHDVCGFMKGGNSVITHLLAINLLWTLTTLMGLKLRIKGDKKTAWWSRVYHDADIERDILHGWSTANLDRWEYGSAVRKRRNVKTYYIANIWTRTAWLEGKEHVLKAKTTKVIWGIRKAPGADLARSWECLKSSHGRPRGSKRASSLTSQSSWHYKQCAERLGALGTRPVPTEPRRSCAVAGRNLPQA
eukprot:6182154-Pleurochrysis_carterae.AAC.2